MKEWLRDNYELVINICLVILSVVIMCIKKKPVKIVDTVKEVICRLLPAAINDVEGKDLSGASKRQAALLLVFEALEDLGYVVTPEVKEFASEQLEVILSTPQKKVR